MARRTVEGADVLAKNIVTFTKRFLDEVNVDMDKSSRVLHTKVNENISLTDHSLRELALMGHPYARRAYRRLHSPEYQVHTQSGAMLGGLYRETEKASVTGGRLVAAAIVGIRDNIAHAIHVIVGTSRMVPRDVLFGSLGEVSDEILALLKRSLKNTVITFVGRETRL